MGVLRRTTAPVRPRINGAAAPAQAAPAKAAPAKAAPAQGRAGRRASAPATVQKQASTTDKPDAATDKAVADKPEDKEAAVGGQTGCRQGGHRPAPRPGPRRRPRPPRPAEQPKPREPAGLKSTGPVSEDEVKPLRGASARVVTNMESSLQVPTATSVRAVPAKLLIDNRVVINNHLKRSRGGKVSFTHLIGYALVKAPGRHAGDEQRLHRPTRRASPRSSCRRTSTSAWPSTWPRRTAPASCWCPSIKSTEAMDFAHFWTAYEDVVRKARNNKLTVEDFQGTTISPDQPGHHRHGPLGAAPHGRARARSSASARWTTPPSGRARARRRSTATPSPRSSR